MDSIELWSHRDRQTGYLFELHRVHMSTGKIDYRLMVTESPEEYGVPIVYLGRKAMKDLWQAIDLEMNPSDAERLFSTVLSDRHVSRQDIEWAKWPWNRCRARKEPGTSGHWGRCERKKMHRGDHALERGMIVMCWSTDWTQWTSVW